MSRLSIFDFEPDIVAYALLREKRRMLDCVPAHFSMDEFLAERRIAFPRYDHEEWCAELDLEERWVAAGRPIFTQPERSNLVKTLAQHGLCMLGR